MLISLRYLAVGGSYNNQTTRTATEMSAMFVSGCSVSDVTTQKNSSMSHDNYVHKKGML